METTIPNTIGAKEFAVLESEDFRARNSTASHPESLMESLRRDETVRSLCEGIDDEAVAFGMLKRVGELSGIQTDLRYFSPYDIPIAAYLFCLSKGAPELFGTATSRVRQSNSGQFFWAPRVASFLANARVGRTRSNSFNSPGDTPATSAEDAMFDVAFPLLNTDWSNLISSLPRFTSETKNDTKTRNAVLYGFLQDLTNPGARDRETSVNPS